MLVRKTWTYRRDVRAHKVDFDMKIILPKNISFLSRAWRREGNEAQDISRLR
jgi:hypothetical protein